MIKEEIYHSSWVTVTKNVESLEAHMLNFPQISCPVIHKFGPGIYMREVFLPKGAIVVGHHQNLEHMNVFLKGRITFFGDNGPVEMTAPHSFVGKPGRKIAYIHEDSVWINIYSTDETDVEKLEAKYLTKSDSWMQDNLERSKVKLLTSSVDKTDYELFLTEFGLTESEVRQISENEVDMIGLRFEDYKIKTGKSSIEGKGLFATGNIESNEIIAPARYDGKRTIAGRYTNHSAFPNAKMVQGKGSDILIMAIKKISGCLGGQDGEEITIDYREALSLNLKIGQGT